MGFISDLLKYKGLAVNKASVANAGGYISGAMGRLRAKAAQLQPLTAFFWTDSTATASNTAVGAENRYVAQWGAQFTANCDSRYGVVLVSWNQDNAVWNSAVRLSTGSAGVDLTIYLCAISGSVPHYIMGSLWNNAALTTQADLLFLGHGINFATWGPTAPIGVYTTAVQRFRISHPNAPVLICTQHPNRDSNTYDNSVAAAKIAAPALEAFINDSVNQAFLAAKAAGTAAPLYNSDGIHESAGPGCALYVAMLNAEWNKAAPALQSAQPKSTLNLRPEPGQNLLYNADFSRWSNPNTAPDGWTLINAQSTVVRDESNGYGNRRYRLKLGSASGGSYTGIQQTISGYNVHALGNRWFCLNYLQVKDQYNTSTNEGLNLGRCQVVVNSVSAGNVNYVAIAYGIRQTDWVWWSLPFFIPDDVNFITVKLFHDNNASSSTTMYTYYDQCSLVPGLLPWAAYADKDNGDQMPYLAAATDASSTMTQLNALIASLKASGRMKLS